MGVTRVKANDVRLEDNTWIPAVNPASARARGGTRTRAKPTTRTDSLSRGWYFRDAEEMRERWDWARS
jgi:hypothetical protein